MAHGTPATADVAQPKPRADNVLWFNPDQFSRRRRMKLLEQPEAEAEGGQRPPASDSPDWKRAAPRWTLVSVIGVAFLVIAFLGGRLSDERTREQHRIDAALADVPTRYQSRLAERVAVLETETHELRESMNKLGQQLQSQAQATNELTMQIRILTAELQKRR